MGAWNSMFIPLAVFPMACKKANKVDSATSLTQLRKVPRFPTIYLQLFHAVKTIFVDLVQEKEKKIVKPYVQRPIHSEEDIL